MTIPEIKLTRDGFKAWLTARPEQQFMRCNASACPLATFLTEVYGSQALVSSDGFRLMTDKNNWTDRQYLPLWATNFYHNFDASGPVGKEHPNGATALAILNESLS